MFNIQKREVRQLVILSLVVVTVHLAFLALTISFYNRHGIDFKERILSQDSGQYIKLGESFLQNGAFVLSKDAEPETFRTPGYPFFVALALFISNGSFWFLFFVQSVLAAGIGAVAYLFARRVELRHRLALFLAFCVGVSPALVLQTITGMGGDVLYTLMFAAAMLLLLKLPQEYSYRLAVAIGAILGLATLVRPLGLYISLPVFAAILFFAPQGTLVRERIIKALVAFALFAAVLVPWMLRNYVVAGHFSLSSVSAYNLAYYNVPEFLAWKHGSSVNEERETILAPMGGSAFDTHKSFSYADELGAIAKEHLLKEGFMSYVGFHFSRTIPFFISSGLNVIGATISSDSSARVPLITPSGTSLGELVRAKDWSGVMGNILSSWPITLERLLWVILFALAFISPLFAKGYVRLFLLLTVLIILANAVITSPVSQPRYRLPIEPMLWVAAAYSAVFIVRAIMKRIWPNRTL